MLDANNLIIDGEYYADESSINFINPNTKYKCIVESYNNDLSKSQIAYSKNNIVSYRTGVRENTLEPFNWTIWNIISPSSPDDTEEVI